VIPRAAAADIRLEYPATATARGYHFGVQGRHGPDYRGRLVPPFLVQLLGIAAIEHDLLAWVLP